MSLADLQRLMEQDRQRKLREAGPSMDAEMMEHVRAMDNGEPMQQLTNEQLAQASADWRARVQRVKTLPEVLVAELPHMVAALRADVGCARADRCEGWQQHQQAGRNSRLVQRLAAARDQAVADLAAATQTSEEHAREAVASVVQQHRDLEEFDRTHRVTSAYRRG